MVKGFFIWKCKGQVPHKKRGLKTGVVLGQGLLYMEMLRTSFTQKTWSENRGDPWSRVSLYGNVMGIRKKSGLKEG